MRYSAGLLKVVCACTVILMQSLDAGHASKKHAAGVSCRPKELTALIKRHVAEGLKSFDEANGKHLGTWSPGFPELQVQQNSPVSWSNVQCSLLFMSLGVQKVLEDQRSNLNPEDVSLHEKLEDIISRANMLATCVKEVLGGDCSPKPTPPKMPKHVFERKQWSHTLLKTARDYLDWLVQNVGVRISKVKGKNMTKRTGTKANGQRYFEGSGYLL